LGFIHNEAVAYELAARFYAARGLDEIAHFHLQYARYGDLRREAGVKVRQLDDMFPELGKEGPPPGPTDTIGTLVDHLDLATVIKASQAMSGEIVRNKLIVTLMRSVVGISS
jgi:hypothetical protein